MSSAFDFILHLTNDVGHHHETRGVRLAAVSAVSAAYVFAAIGAFVAGVCCSTCCVLPSVACCFASC